MTTAESPAPGLQGPSLSAEIAEQPGAVQRLVARLPTHIDEIRTLASGCDAVTLVARGSSDNVARYGQYALGVRARRHASLAAPSLTTVYDRTPGFERQLVVAVSQSGQSSDIRAVVRAAREQGRPTVAITNDASSPLAYEADYVLGLDAGTEHAVAATKTYTTSLIAMAAVALALGPVADEQAGLEDLRRLPDLMSRTLDVSAAPAAQLATVLQGLDRAVTIGRGLNLSTAHEIGLKLTELTGIQVAPYSPADLLHGPIGAVDSGVAALVVAAAEPAIRSTLEVVPALAARGAPVILIAAPEDLGPSDRSAAGVLPIAATVPWWLTPVVAVLPGQLLAHATAQARGRDPDQPAGLTKITDTR